MEERPIDFPMPLDSVIGGDAEMNGTGPDWIWDQPRYSSEEILLEDALASEVRLCIYVQYRGRINTMMERLCSQ
jgi:hypothetical protein